jgi:pilus assembly protein CpaE
MGTTIDAFVVLGDDAAAPLVEAAIPPGGQINLTGLVENLGEADRALLDPSSDLLIVASSGSSESVVDFVRRSVAERPERPVVALAETPPEYFVQALFEAGADDLVKLPETPERVVFTLEKAVARHRKRDGNGVGELAPMVCILGPKGGTGKTVTACNLTVGLAEGGKRAVVVDLDLQFGDIGLALGLEPRRTLYDLATSGGALDAEKLEAYLVGHPSGARALLAPVRPDQASAVTIDLLREVYSLLRSTHDLVVVDTPPEFTPEVIAAVDSSSHVCMVAAMDSLSLKNTKLGLETLELMGYDPDSVTLVLNRANSQVGITRGDVEAIVGRHPDVLVPSDRDVPRSINEGIPIISGKTRSGVAAAYRELIQVYAPMPVEARVNGARRFRLFGRRKS